MNTLTLRFAGVVVFLTLMLSCSGKDDHNVVHSPNGRIAVLFKLNEGTLYFELKKDKEQILDASPLGIQIKNIPYGDFKLVNTVSSSENRTWEPVWDKNSSILDHFNETVFWLEGKDAFKMGIVIRLYDDAAAIRYEIPEQKGLREFTIAEDLTSFQFPRDYTFWAANGENHNLGPARISQFANEVGSSDKDGNPEAIKISKVGFMPMVVDLGESGYMALLEAAIYDHDYFHLVPGDGPYGLRSKMAPSEGQTPFKTSWRVVLLGDGPGNLVESNTLMNLNPPCAIEDPSWIKPGKAVWDWRVWGYTAENGFEYGLDTESHKRFIDFAAKNNIKYLLMDADWYGPEFSPDADPTSANDKINVEENMAYAKSKGVGIILYLNDVGAKKFGLEKILKQFSDWGASGVKYGFMTNSGQEKVQYTRRVVELCAKYQLTVNFHDGPVPPSGDRRTWPNLVTREYGHSQADAKKSYYPETVVNQVFINMITGPLDMCNLWFGFEDAESRVRVFEKIPGTVAAEVAKLAALFSGIHIIPDAPEEYDKKSDLFDFIRTLPDSFDELRVLDGQIDEFVSVGRRKGDNWYIGSLNNREGRQISIHLSFLEEGSEYEATLYADAADTHYLKNQETYQVTKINVRKGDVITAKLAPGGGHAIRLIKQ